MNLSRQEVLNDFTIQELIFELSTRDSNRVLEIDNKEIYVIASKERHCIFGEGPATILVIKK